MIELTIDNSSDTMKEGEIIWDNKPQDWDGKVLELQSKYIELQKSSYPLNFDQTIQELLFLIYQYNLLNENETELSECLAFSAMNLLELYLIFYSEDTTELYGTGIGKRLLINHFSLGKIKLNLSLTQQLWDALKLRAEYDSGFALTSLTPSLKIGFHTPVGNLRVSLQIPPLTPDGVNFNIRRLPKDSFSLESLVNGKQINSIFSHILEDAIKKRNNIIIAGEPGSGKTTLANSLLNRLDPNLRIIILEDAQEIQLSKSRFPLSTRIKLPTVGEEDRYNKRSDEMSRLLHRSPDYVFLGEIQNKDDTLLTFEAFAAGIRGMATTHAKNFEGLLLRWNQSHKLSAELIYSIDYIVIMKKTFEKGVFQFYTDKIYSHDKNKGEFIEIKDS